LGVAIDWRVEAHATNQIKRVGLLDLADTSTRAYLEYLHGCDQSSLSTQNRILFWAALLKQHAAALPKSVEFLAAHFPEIDLDKPLPIQRFVARERSNP